MSVKHLIAPSVMTLALAGLVACGTKKKDDAPSGTEVKSAGEQACLAEVKKAKEEKDYKFSNDALKSYAEALGLKEFEKGLDQAKCSALAKAEAEAEVFSPVDAATFTGKAYLVGLKAVKKLDLNGVTDIKDTTHGTNKAERDAINEKLLENEDDGQAYISAVDDLLNAGDEATDVQKKAVTDGAEKVKDQLAAAKTTSEAYIELEKLIRKTVAENQGANDLDNKVLAEGSKVVSTLTTAEAIDLGNNAGIHSVSDSLKGHKNLAEVGLYGTSVSVAGTGELVKALHKDGNKTLKTIYTQHAADQWGADEFKGMTIKVEDFNLKKIIDDAAKKNEGEEDKK